MHNLIAWIINIKHLQGRVLQAGAIVFVRPVHRAPQPILLWCSAAPEVASAGILGGNFDLWAWLSNCVFRVGSSVSESRVVLTNIAVVKIPSEVGWQLR